MTARRGRWQGGWAAVAGAAVVLLMALLAPSAQAATNPFVIALEGDGTGYVTSNPPGLDCGEGYAAGEHETCSFEFPEENVELIAHGGPHSIFVAYDGKVNSNCAYTSCTAYDNQLTEVGAKFEGGAQELTVTLGGDGAGAVFGEHIYCGAGRSECSESQLAGATVTIYEDADSESEFTGWTGDCSGTSLECTLTLDADKSVEATFAKKAEEPKEEHHVETAVTTTTTTPTTTAPATTTPTPSVSPPKPSNAFHLGKPGLNRRKGTARVKVVLPGPGQITLKGKGIKTFAKKVATGGPLILPIEASGPPATELRRSGVGAATVKVTFKPKGGTARTLRLTVKLLHVG
jgi:Divergent InlB B-repeat domain